MNQPAHKPDDSWSSGGRTFACYAARLMADNHCENVIVLELKGLSQVADYFVIGTGTSDRQLHAVADDLKRLARREEQSIFRMHGRSSGEWVVMDLVDVVAHLFTESQRAYYDLESLWGDAARVDWQSATTPGQFARLRSEMASDPARG